MKLEHMNRKLEEIFFSHMFLYFFFFLKLNIALRNLWTLPDNNAHKNRQSTGF